MLVPFFAHVHVCHSVVSNSLLRPVQKHPTKVFQSVFVCVRARARALCYSPGIQQSSEVMLSKMDLSFYTPL